MGRSNIYKALAVVFVWMLSVSISFGQCAMCKAAAEQASTEESSYNSGILYLMIIPYILFGFIGFFWYKQSRKNREKKEQIENQIKKHIPSFSSH